MRLGKQVRGVRQMFHGVIFVQLESRFYTPAAGSTS